jgi:hypothetical protein
MFRTNGIVNSDIEHAETVARLLGDPRGNVDDAREVFDSLNADAHTLALFVREWSPLTTIREVSAHEVEVIAQPPPTEMHPAERDAALARYVTDARARLRRSNPDFQPPARTDVGSEDAALLRDALGAYLDRRASGDSVPAPSEQREPENPLPSVSKAFAAAELFKVSEAELDGLIERNEIAWRKNSRQCWTFDRDDVGTWSGLTLTEMRERVSQHRTAQTRQRREAAQKGRG